ncbi:hypothetical protein DH2020_000425 [Rehmannia glutinosa]|uniref:mRNA-decapping enzyme-like protein n=1 Tax=Rehmannia glutinosa TaxID=99300 RepID=A0ABR0XWX1_REHGL
MSQNGKLMPNLDEKTTKVLNLTVLQRIDPFVEEILITAAHVTFYEFNIDTSQWSRKDVEGSLFVVKRFEKVAVNMKMLKGIVAMASRFDLAGSNQFYLTESIPVLTLRQSRGMSTEEGLQLNVLLLLADNLVENLLGDFEYEVQVPYLLYRNASQERSCAFKLTSDFGISGSYWPSCSEFEELEAVPTLAVIDGPLEPPSSTTANITDAPDDPSFVNFFSTAMNTGGIPNAAISGQPYLSSVISTSHPQTVALPTLPTAQTQPNLSASTPIMSILDNSEPNNAAKRSTNLVKPSTFFGPPPSSSPLVVPPISSSTPTAPPLNPPGNMQRPYGAPLLQPFPPPTPPPSLTPSSVPTPNYGPPISREKVREALQILVQSLTAFSVCVKPNPTVHPSFSLSCMPVYM